MRKVILAGLLMVALAFAPRTESIDPGLNILKVSDETSFSDEHIVGAGDTVWTKTYDFLQGGLYGIVTLSFDIDTFAACSSKVEVILREGNTDGDWDLQTSVETINHAPSDWDTTFELDVLPTAFFRVGFLCGNGSNDSNKVNNVRIFAIKW